jgi:hypothetical protein
MYSLGAKGLNMTRNSLCGNVGYVIRIKAVAVLYGKFDFKTELITKMGGVDFMDEFFF